MAAIGLHGDILFLHFELCYYQAIDAAIARDSAASAGAQGSYKLARGYVPRADMVGPLYPRSVLSPRRCRFPAQRAPVSHDREWLNERTPFRKAD